MRSTVACNERYKLTLYTNGGLSQREFFDLKSDPDELRNLTGEPGYAEAELALLAEITAFLEREAGAGLPRASSSIPTGTHRLRNSIR